MRRRRNKGADEVNVKGVDKTPFFMPYYKGNQEAHMSYYNWQPVYEQHNEEIRWFKTRFGLFTTQVLKDGEWVNSSTGATLDQFGHDRKQSWSTNVPVKV